MLRLLVWTSSSPPAVLAAAAMVAALGSTVACGADDAAAGATSDGEGGAPPATSDGPTTLEFQPGSALTLAPGETRELVVRAHPPDTYLVSFALLGETEDASLDRSEGHTDDTGTAAVALTAPTSGSAGTAFAVRATVGTAVSAEIEVSVHEGGEATLEVIPSYAGHRQIESWVASVRPGADCASLPSIPAPDGDLTAETQSADGVPVVSGVPVGRLLAVTLRAGFFAGGCVEVERLTAGARQPVVVPVTDVPLSLRETELDVVLAVQTVLPSWDEVVRPLIEESAAALPGASGSDVEALLDAMHAGIADAADAESFTAARAAGSWNAVIAATLGTPEPATALRDVATRWMTAGAAELIQDTLRGRLVAAGEAPGWAQLTIETFAGVDPREAGLPPHNLVSWVADPDDTVLLGATLYWLPSQWLAQVAMLGASEDVPEAYRVADALAAIIDCTGIGTALAEAGPALEIDAAACAGRCLAALCESATGRLWQRAGAASATTPVTLRISAVGAASVDGMARPAEFDGTWVGTLGVGEGAELSGPAMGSPPLPAP